MTHLNLTLADVIEILSSLLLASMPFNQRLNLAPTGSLCEELILTPEATPPEIPEEAARLFGIEPVPCDGVTLRHWAEIILPAWSHASSRLTFSTSGTTGLSSPVTHDFAILAQEIHTLSQYFPGTLRIVSHVPRHHIYGFLFSILLPKALRTPVLWRDPLPTPGLVQDLTPGDLIIGFPMFWKAMAQCKLQFPESSAGITSTGPCPAEIIDAVCSRGLLRVTEIYGASETGGIGLRHSPRTAYTLMGHWQRKSNDLLQRIHPTTRRKMAYMPQDELHWEDERHFMPLGRKDKAVQVAGVNVFPSHVRQIILTHPGIQDCAVRPMRPDEGERLKALIVPEPGAFSSSKELLVLQQWLKEKLSHYEVPGSIRCAGSIPLNALGKVQDW